MDEAKTKQAIGELSRIWQASTGSRIEMIERGTRLWHCGRIETHEQMDDGKGLWAMRNAERCDEYKGFAYSKSDSNNNEPTMLELEVLRKLRAADFGLVSLFDFAVNFCESDHNVLKDVLREWMLDNELHAVVGANKNGDEVVLARPRSDTVVVATCRL